VSKAKLACLVSVDRYARVRWLDRKQAAADVCGIQRKHALPTQDATGRRREIVLMTIASEFAFVRMMGIFLASLANTTFPAKDG
jgi:hypothetical protein